MRFRLCASTVLCCRLRNGISLALRGGEWESTARQIFAAFAASREAKAGWKGTAREDAKARRRQ